MGGGEGEVMLVITGEGEAERCSSTVGGEIHVVDEATERFLVRTVKVGSSGWKAHCVTEFLAGEGLTVVAKSAIGPAAVWSAREAV